MKIVPAPSPNGTNHERLFLFRMPMRGPRGAYDQALSDEPDTGELLVRLHKLLAECLSGSELERAMELVTHHLGGHKYDGAASDQDDDEDDAEESEEALRERRKKTMAKVADFLSTKNGLDESEIAESLRDFPRPGLEHLGGALDDDLTQVLEQRRSGMAKDARLRRQAFDSRWPDSRRVDGDPLETSYGVQPEQRRIATDSATADRVAARWPEADRIR